MRLAKEGFTRRRASITSLSLYFVPPLGPLLFAFIHNFVLWRGWVGYNQPAEVEGVPREMQGHAVLIQQKQAIEYEIERTVQEEQALIQVCERTGVRLDGLNENSGIGTEMVTGDGVSVGGEMSLPGEKNQAHGLEALHMKGDGQMMDGVEGRSGGERLRDVTPSESEAPGDDGQLRASAAGDDVGGFSLRQARTLGTDKHASTSTTRARRARYTHRWSLSIQYH